MLQQIILIISFISLCLLIALLTLTTPADAGPFGLLAIFVTAYLSFLGAISFFLYGANHLLRLVTTSMTLRKPIQSLSFRRAYYYATALALAPVMLMGLQSVRSIGIQELLLVLTFEVIACLYISRRIA